MKSARTLRNNGAVLPARCSPFQMCDGRGPGLPAGQHCPSVRFRFQMINEVAPVAHGHGIKSLSEEVKSFSCQLLFKSWDYIQENLEFCLFNKPKGLKHLLIYIFNQENQNS